jgi:hypothetical protein
MYNPLAVPVVMLIAGLVLAFRGRKLVILALIIGALATGLLHGSSLLSSVTDNSSVLLYGPVALAILFAVLVSFLYRAAFFVAGVFIGYFILSLLFPNPSPAVSLPVAVLAGALVYISRNFVFSVLTSIMGAGLAATGSVNLIAWAGVSAGVTAYMVILAVTAISGILYQTTGKRGRK